MSTTASVVVVATSVVVVVSSATDVVVSIVVGAATEVEPSVSSIGVALEHATRAHATSPPMMAYRLDRGVVFMKWVESG